MTERLCRADDLFCETGPEKRIGKCAGRGKGTRFRGGEVGRGGKSCSSESIQGSDLVEYSEIDAASE